MSSSFSREFGHLRISLESIKKATNDFCDSKFIAEGAYGKVYKGEFPGPKGLTIGAVKRWNPSIDGVTEFLWEIKLLSENTHKNIIKLIHFCDEKKERILVYEFAHNRSLDIHLQNPKFWWAKRLKICLEAARGLEYLHNPKGAVRVLHFDIKSGNILLDENWNAKIADFGLAKNGLTKSNASYLITHLKGTPGYADPKFVETCMYTKESDVYSFGVVLLEVLCSRFSYDPNYTDMRRTLPVLVKNSTKKQIRDTLVCDYLRKQMRGDSFDKFLTVALQCVKTEQNQRPSMDKIVKNLEAALKDQEDNSTRFSMFKLALWFLQLGIAGYFFSKT